jgi:hypothetical protein
MWTLEGSSKWLILCNEILYGLPTFVKVVNSWRLQWVKHVAGIWETVYAFRISVGKSLRKWLLSGT